MTKFFFNSTARSNKDFKKVFYDVTLEEQASMSMIYEPRTNPDIKLTMLNIPPRNMKIINVLSELANDRRKVAAERTKVQIQKTGFLPNLTNKIKN